MVVGDDVDLAALLAELLDTLDPVLELVLGVEIIVAGVAAGAFPEPVLVIPAMEADIGELGIGTDGRGSDRVLEDGLVDVTESRPVLAQQLVKAGPVPAPVADLDGQGESGEQTEEPEEVVGVRWGIGVGPGELDEEGGQPALKLNELSRGLECVDVLLSEALSLVGEDLVELQRE